MNRWRVSLNNFVTQDRVSMYNHRQINSNVHMILQFDASEHHLGTNEETLRRKSVRKKTVLAPSCSVIGTTHIRVMRNSDSVAPMSVTCPGVKKSSKSEVVRFIYVNINALESKHADCTKRGLLCRLFQN